ncbi:Aste57867_13471 [Aphanomyces stellatus]|uniref:Aste57867_13471 protein n=1 Tax=Aphanomyces stellatus TaxID=120398 RepID=A0A485KYY7_9STRA|nr:hypothetical protein As57867_013421 [Aphanomyces stellatus]VFT90309.1 Aste57867_13471 [Aphanomyces stellatus]
MSPEELTFTLVLLALYVVPATFVVLRRLFADPKACLTKFFVLHFLVLLISYVFVWQLIHAIQTSDMIAFDPYEILSVPEYATKKTIKKAYRALSQRLHPDKSSDPLATSKFAKVAKAYEALTDPVGIANYKKFGHPDGASFTLVDFKAMSGTTGLTIIAAVYGVMILLGIVMALFGGDRYKPEMNPETVQKIMANWHDKMTMFDVLVNVVTGVKQPLEEKASGDCCGGGGSLYEMDDEMKAFLVAMETHQCISAIEHRDIGRLEQDHIQRDVIALYYYFNQAKAKAADVTVPCVLPKRMKDIVFQMPYLLDVFVELSIKVAAEKRSDATTLVNALRLYSALAQASLTVDAAAIAAQRARFSESAKTPAMSLDEATLTVDGEDDIYPRDWVTLHVKATRAHVPAGARAPLALTAYDKTDKGYLYRKEHLWVVAKDVSTHVLLGCWKVEDAADSHQVEDALGFWAPQTTGEYKVDVRVLSTTYVDTETSQTVAMNVVKAPPQASSSSIFEEVDDE